MWGQPHLGIGRSGLGLLVVGFVFEAHFSQYEDFGCVHVSCFVKLLDFWFVLCFWVVVHVEFYGFFVHALADSGPECAFQFFFWHDCFPASYACSVVKVLV